MTIVYCPTHEMLADFFTKPLQGSLFRKFRDVLLGHQHVSTLTNAPSVPAEERVEQPKLPESRAGTNGAQTTQNGGQTHASEPARATETPTYAAIAKKRIQWAATSNDHGETSHSV